MINYYNFNIISNKIILFFVFDFYIDIKMKNYSNLLIAKVVYLLEYFKIFCLKTDFKLSIDRQL
jgi:hypothetical protein